jgi:CheY-like chemotaxis protein
VLLAEDEEPVRTLARRALEAAGYTVLEAVDGLEAQEIAESYVAPIDVLLSDVVMPRVGGRELAERLTAARPGLRVLFVSGYTDDAVVRQGIQHEEVNFLQKPFSPAALTRKIREVLDGVKVCS